MSNRLHLKIKIKLFAVVLTNSFFLTDRVAVVLHGLLGYRRNWYFFIKKFSALHPNLSFLLVDLRNHGDSHVRAFSARGSGFCLKRKTPGRLSAAHSSIMRERYHEASGLLSSLSVLYSGPFLRRQSWIEIH